MNPIKIILSLLVLMAVACAVNAQAPEWRANPSDFQYTMTVTAFLNLEGRNLESANDIAGAFVGDEVRGSANLIYVAGADRYLAYLTVYANKESDVIEFKIYDSGNNKIIPTENTLPFRIDAQVGNILQAFSLARPVLSSEAIIKNFDFKNISTVDTDISDGFVEIVVGYEKDITALIPEFSISDGAKMYIEKTLQISGDTALDFTFPIHYSVVSEDESVITTYQVKVNNEQVGGDSGFLCSNVITANGDGNNDFWYVQNVSDYNDYNFKILDINGRILFESKGYNNDWAGYYKGNKLDRGKYYFEVENQERESLITGSILVMY